MDSFVVSIYAVSHVPHAACLEHIFVAARDTTEAETQARAIFGGAPGFGRYSIALVRTSRLPPPPTEPQTRQPQDRPGKGDGMADTIPQLDPREDRLLAESATHLRALSGRLEEHAWDLSVRDMSRALATVAQHLRDTAHSLELLAMMVPAMENMPPEKKAEVNARARQPRAPELAQKGGGDGGAAGR